MTNLPVVLPPHFPWGNGPSFAFPLGWGLPQPRHPLPDPTAVTYTSARPTGSSYLEEGLADRGLADKGKLSRPLWRERVRCLTVMPVMPACSKSDRWGAALATLQQPLLAAPRAMVLARRVLGHCLTRHLEGDCDESQSPPTAFDFAGLFRGTLRQINSSAMSSSACGVRVLRGE